MDIEPNDLLIFARVVDAGSFSRAAERLGLPKSTLSRRVAGLETRLGERLLTRTTRKLVLTEFGSHLLEHARRVVDEAESAAALAQHRQAVPTGRLRVSMPSDFATLVLADVLAAFTARYPEVVLELDLSARRVDLIGENFDLALRMGVLADDATLAARRVAQFTAGLYAAPAYTAIHGLPETPADLVRHRLVSLLGARGAALPWTLTQGKVRWQEVPAARLIANSPELLVKLACLGAGIAACPDAYAQTHVARGELVRVLPRWCMPAVDCWAVFPGRRLMPAKTRAFLDMLEETCAGRLPTPVAGGVKTD